MSRLKKAMQRAREMREGSPEAAPARSSPIGKASVPASRSQKTGALEKKEIQIQYSKTRVQRADKEILKRNKVVSLFKDHAISSEIEILRTQVLSKLNKVGGNTLLVTSAHPGEGKTFTSINLGISIAQQLDRTVLIVDCDLRNPWKNHFDFASDFFGFTITRGLADYLIDDLPLSEVIINPGIEKVTILPGGRPLSNSAELLSSKKMENLVSELKYRYQQDRIVIFDSPALLACTDPLVFSHMIDGVVLVVQAERTTPGDIRKAIDLLNERPIFGTVLNRSREPKEKYV
jgi:non-specific protein-tyrosine kinase